MKEDAFKQKLHERVVQVVGRFKSQNEMARKICVPNGTMSAYMTQLRGYAVPLGIVMNCPEISLEWLFRGEGAMLIGMPKPTPEPEAKPLPHPGADPALVKILLDRIETQAVELSRLREENDRFKRALGVL